MGNGSGRSNRVGSAGAGAGISLTAHTFLGLLIWTGVATSGRVKGVDVGSGEMGAVTVGLLEDLLPAPPAPAMPASLAAPKNQRPHRAVSAGIARHKVTQSAIKTPGTGELTSAVSAPPIEAITTTSEARVATPPIVPTTSSLAPPSVQAALAVGPPQSGAPAEPAPSTRPAPPFVEAEVATYLRSQDFFPSLPSSLRARGAHYQARLDICVSTEGRVVDVGFRQPATPALESVLASAVRGWRYRPLMVNGAPAPFCHRMTVSYETM